MVNNLLKKILSKIIPELRDKTQTWILSNPNLIDSPDRNIFLKVGKRGSSNIVFAQKVIKNYC